MCFLLMTLVLVLILNPLLDFFFLYIKLMCPYFILLIYTDGERDGLWMACPFRTLVVLYRMFPFIICLILMNYLMEFYFIGFVNAHLPGCFCPWTFRLNIGLNTSPSDSFVSFKFPSRIFCRRVPGFATDCPCGVWCRGLTTCLLYVGPPLEF